MKKELGGTFDPSLYTGPKSEVVKNWMEAFTEGNFTPENLREWISPVIPGFYSVESSGSMFRRLKSSNPSTLTGYLEEFIYNGEREKVAEFFQRNSEVPLQCGKVLKLGEPSYNCRECSTDHTCVMCADCFHKSNHRYHKYRMATSIGGGFCDCGDTEAWRNHPYCETHQPSSRDDSVPVLPPDMEQRSKLVFSFALQFCHDVINKFYSADLRVPMFSGEEQYLLLMYNDEIHTFDQVIKLLVHVIRCTPKEGLKLASRINYEGRAIVMASNFDNCTRMKLAIEGLSSALAVTESVVFGRGRDRSLEVHVLPFNVVAHQCFALDVLFKWMQTLLKSNESFRSALIGVLEVCSPKEVSLLDKVLVQDSVMWLCAKAQRNAVLCSVFLPQNRTKRILAERYLANYPKIVQNYLNDDEDHTSSIAGLSVQLFTVPSIAQELISRYGALEQVLTFIINVSTNDRNANGKLVFKRMFSRSFERACYFLYDVRYLLCSPPAGPWHEQLRVGFCRGMNSFLDFLGLIEGMDAHTRQLGSHIEFEPEWETVYNLLLKCIPVIIDSLKWCALDEQALEEVFQNAVHKLEIARRDPQRKPFSMDVFGSRFQCPKFNSAENAVSIHLPLTRYWGALYQFIHQHDHLTDTVTESAIHLLIDPVMETRAMIAQFRSGMWHKNGQSLSSQVLFYHCAKFRDITLDLDIVLLQIGASRIESNRFLTTLAYKFGLLSFILPDKETTCDLPDMDNNKLWGLVDEFLYTIIIVTTERFQVGIGMNVNCSAIIKHELIHLLTVEPMTYSELNKALGSNVGNELSQETVIKELTLFKLTAEPNGKGKYELKDHHHPEFNVFFYHFTKESSFKAEQIKKAQYKNENGLECCPPPILPQFLEPYSKITNLLNCDAILHVMETVLDAWLKEAEQGIDGQLHKVLFLFGVALREEERPNSTYEFTAKAKTKQIATKIVEIYCSGRLKDQKDLVKWVLQKYGSTTGDGSIEAVMIDHDEKQKKEILKSDAKSRAEAARAKIMANMRMMQEQFNKKCLESVREDVNKEVSVASTKIVAQAPSSSDNQQATDTSSSLQRGHISSDTIICILCQGVESLAMSGKAMVYAAFVQLSTVHMRNRDPFTPEDLREILLTTRMGPCPIVKTCGHVMHAYCWEAWQIDLIRSRATAQSQGRPHSHDPSKHEFLCPLCGCISNTILPIMPSDILPNVEPQNQSTNTSLMCSSFLQWLDVTLNILHVIKVHESQPVSASCQSASNLSDSLLDQSSTYQSGITQFKQNMPCSASQSKPANLRIIVDGYNLNIGDWVLNIKRLVDATSLEQEPALMDITTEKLNWVHALGSEIFRVATNSQPLEAVNWDCTMVWKTLAYTIQSFEATLRYARDSQGRRPVSFLREELCLENLIIISYVLSLNKKPQFLRLGANQCALKLLEMVVNNDENCKCILEWDCFGLLVPLLAVSPTLVASSLQHLQSLEKFLVRLMLVARMAQIMSTMDMEQYKVESPESSDDTSFLPFAVNLLRHERYTFDGGKVWEELKKRVVPFLRSCSIFFFYKNILKHNREFSLFDDDFDTLARFLQLPTSCKELLGENLTMSLLMTWGQHPKVRDLYVDSPTSWKFEPYIKGIGTNRMNRLVELPEDYSELLIMVRDFSCPASDINDSHNPTMCLVCGKILCSLSYCCQVEFNHQKVGACTFHAYECGGGISIFLRIRECRLFILTSAGRGQSILPPYFDEHHEPDQGLRRGNRLLLCQKSYRRLEADWINHSLHESVARAIEMGGLSNWLFF